MADIRKRPLSVPDDRVLIRPLAQRFFEGHGYSLPDVCDAEKEIDVIYPPVKEGPSTEHRSPDELVVERTGAVDGYQLIRRMATSHGFDAYLARQQSTHQLVVLKFLLPHLTQSAELVHIFLEESKLRLNWLHANVVRIIEVNDVTGTIFIAEEYAGCPMAHLVDFFREEGPGIAPSSIARIGYQICEGLQYVHQSEDERDRRRYFVHGGLSGLSLFLSSSGRIKMGRFSQTIAEKRCASEFSHHAVGHPPTFGGTRDLSSFSPEQARGKRLDLRSDLFTLGGWLYEYATYKKPVSGLSGMDMLRSLLMDGAPPPVETIRPDFPAALSRIIAQALEKYPEDRYQTIEELQRDLAMHL